MIFLQKKHTKHRKHKELKEINEQEILENQEFPEVSRKIIFGEFDNYRNNSIAFGDWIKFVANSFVYCQLTLEGVRKIFI